jgi:hypothetical protein
MNRNVKKGLVWMTACCGFMMVQVPFGAQAAQSSVAETIPPYVEVPEKGEYKMGGDNPAVGHDGKLQTGTEFYLRIENPKSVIQDSGGSGSSGGSGNNGGSGNSGGSGSNGGSGNRGTSRGSRNSGGSDDSSAKPRSITYANFPMGNDVEMEELGELADQDGNLPKTGDYGPDKIVLCELALLFGTGYLLCDYYEKRNEKKQNSVQ